MSKKTSLKVRILAGVLAALILVGTIAGVVISLI